MSESGGHSLHDSFFLVNLFNVQCHMQHTITTLINMTCVLIVLILYIAAVSSCFMQLFLSSLHGTSELSHLGFSKDSSKPKHLGVCCQSNSSLCLPSLSYLLEPIYALCHVMSIFLWRLAGRASAELKHWYTAASNMICICDVKFFHALFTSR